MSKVSHGKPEPEGIRSALCDGLVELLAEVAEQLRLGHLEATRVPRVLDGVVELEVCKAGDVVEVERVGGVIAGR